MGKEIDCEYCKAKAGDPCVTSTGKIYNELHSKRFHHLSSNKTKRYRKSVDTSADGIRVALWFVKTCGGIEKARSFLDAAALALESCSEQDNHSVDTEVGDVSVQGDTGAGGLDVRSKTLVAGCHMP